MKIQSSKDLSVNVDFKGNQREKYSIILCSSVHSILKETMKKWKRRKMTIRLYARFRSWICLCKKNNCFQSHLLRLWLKIIMSGVFTLFKLLFHCGWRLSKEYQQLNNTLAYSGGCRLSESQVLFDIFGMNQMWWNQWLQFRYKIWLCTISGKWTVFRLEYSLPLLTCKSAELWILFQAQIHEVSVNWMALSCSMQTNLKDFFSNTGAPVYSENEHTLINYQWVVKQ